MIYHQTATETSSIAAKPAIAAQPKPAEPISYSVVAEKQLRILLISSSVDNWDLFSRAMQSSGYEDVCRAHSAQNAFERLEFFNKHQDESSFDLIFVEHELEDLDGLEVCRLLRSQEKYNDVPIVLCESSEESSIDLTKALYYGATDLLYGFPNRTQLAAKTHALGRLRYEVLFRKAREKDLLETTLRLEDLLRQSEKDLNTASTLQASLLPQKPFIDKHLNVDWVFKPSQRVSGDMFNVLHLQDNKYVFYLLDVAGHGVRAAMKSFSLSHLLIDRGFGGSILLNRKGELRCPKELLLILNSAFLLEEDDLDYFTIVYGVLDLNTNKLSFSSAGHPMPMLIAKNGSRNTFTNHPRGFPIGMFEHSDYENCEIDFNPGDRLCLFSDGVFDRLGAKTSSSVGLNQLYAKLSNLQMYPLDQAIEHLSSILLPDSDNFDDDITLLALERKE